MKTLTASLSKKELILGWIYLPAQLFLLPTIIVLVNLFAGSPLSEAECNFVYFCANFIGVTVIFWPFLRHNTALALGNFRKCLFSAFKGLGLYFLLSTAVSYLIAFVYPDFTNVNDASIDQMVDQNAVLMNIGTVFLVPITEELLYRGLVFRSIQGKNRVWAYVISILLFAALHVIGYIGSYEPLHLFMCLLQYLPAGFCLAWAYEQADSIWAPILIHVSINQIGMLAMMRG